jgi:hypothetical protein
VFFENSFDVGVLSDNDGVLSVTSGVQSSEGLQCLVVTAFHHEPSRRFGQQESEEDEGNGRKSLETERETPLEASSHSSLLTGVTDPSGNKGSDTKEELESSGKTTTVGRVSDLRLVKWGQDTLASVGSALGLTICPIPKPAKNRPAIIISLFMVAV